MRFIVLLLLSLSLSTSSFHLKTFLENIISDGDFSQNQLNHALELNMLGAQKVALLQSRWGSKHWLQIAKNVAPIDAHYSWQLARFYAKKSNRQQQLFWHKKAIKLGSYHAIVAQANNLYFYVQQSPKLNVIEQQKNLLQAKLLLQQVDILKPEHYDSNRSLKKQDELLPIEDDELVYEQIDPVLKNYDILNQAIQISIRIAIKLEDTAWFNTLIKVIDVIKQDAIKRDFTVKNATLLHNSTQYSLALKHLEELMKLEENLNKYQVINKEKNSTPNNNIAIKPFEANKIESGPDCERTIRFYASDYDHLINIDNKLKKIFKQPFFSSSFCLLPTLFIAEQYVLCEHESSERIQCNVEVLNQGSILSQNAAHKESRREGYRGFVTRQGNANVNNSNLFIDDNDSQQVIEHELLHLIGFIDEYPLPVNHNACLQNNTIAIAKNIIVDNSTVYINDKDARQQLKAIIPWFSLIKPSTPIVHKTDKGYVLGTPEHYKQDVGLFLTNTCQYQKQNAFKAVFQPTKLEYFEELIPNVYKSDVLKHYQQFNMPRLTL